MSGVLIDDLAGERTETSSGTLADDHLTGWLPVDDAAICRVLALGDPAVRNLWITQSYADLGERMRSLLGGEHSWCSFATWMSVTAGVAIRTPQLPRMRHELVVGAEDVVDAIIDRTNRRTRVRRALGLCPPLDRSHVDGMVDEALANAARRVAHHTTATYATLAPLFVRFIEAVEDDADAIRDDRVDDLLDEIGLPSGHGDPELREAFREYAFAASPASDDADRARRVLAANILVTIVEQRSAQDDIAATFTPAAIDIRGHLARAMYGRIPAIVRHRLATSVYSEIDEDVEDLWHHVSTRLLHEIVLPGEMVHVGRDVSIDERDAIDTAGHATLEQLLVRWDPTGGTGIGAATWDWSDLDSRVGFLVNLLRARQIDPTLSTPPFTPGELTVIADEAVPPLG